MFVVELAVVPDELNIVENFLHGIVPIFSQFLVDGAQIHRVLDDGRVVDQPHALFNEGEYFASPRALETRASRCYREGIARWF